MAFPLALDNVSFTFPNGNTLLSNITTVIQEPRCALVGRNGVGKSVLGQLLSNTLKPTAGTIQHNQKTHYIPQQWPGPETDSVLDMLGLQNVLRAMTHIENGSAIEQDFEIAETHWSWKQDIKSAFRITGISPELDLTRKVSSFSGGEQMRLMWSAALYKNPDVYIFDEPTNHLDREGRVRFSDWLKRCSKKSLLITHDRHLLSQVDAIYELTPNAVHRHAGNYDVYIETKEARWENAQSKLDNRRREQALTKKKAQQSFEKAQQRAAKGKETAAKRNWSSLEIGCAKEAASATLKHAKVMRRSRDEQTERRVADAEANREWFDPIGFTLPNSALSDRQRVLSLTNFSSGIAAPLHKPINNHLMGAFRLHIQGENGIGKSVLLKSIMGHLTPQGGDVSIHVQHAHLDQHHTEFEHTRTAVENVQLQHPDLTENGIRERLALLRLRNEKADINFGNLSGGEQLKVALVCKLLGTQTPQLLFLDEPTNHLDLDSVHALEKALAVYKGSVIIVSHDQSFVDTLNITHRLLLPDNLIELV